MKRKTIYILLVVCSLSLFSSAKQIGKGADYNLNSDTRTKKAGIPCKETRQDQPGAYGFSPMHFFLLAI